MENTEIRAYLQTSYTSVEFETFSDEYLENSIPHIDMILENKHEQHF